MVETRIIGKVEWFDEKKGFGVISHMDNQETKEYFAHHSEINVNKNVFRALYQDEDVEFIHSYNEDKKKLVAKKINGVDGNKLKCENNLVKGFEEKPRGDGKRINGGYFILSPKCIDLIAGDDICWEDYPIKKLAEMGELMAFNHDNFWQPMDTLREKNLLEELWRNNKAPWKSW